MNIMAYISTIMQPEMTCENKKSRFVKRDLRALPQGLEPWTP